MKKLLFLVLDYAPHNATGAIRATKIVKYIPLYGFKPYVITAKSDRFLVNKEMLKDIPDQAEVYYYKTNLNAPKFLHKRKGYKRSFFGKCLVLLKDLIIIPDKYMFWNFKVLLQMIKLTKEKEIDVVFTTGPPFSNFISVCLLKLVTGSPVILDFRDPWHGHINNVQQSFLRRFYAKYLEILCVNLANGVVTTTASITSRLKKVCRSTEIITIHNGFDWDDLETPNSKTSSIEKIDNEFLFVYTGKVSILYDMYHPGSVIKAFIKFQEESDAINAKLMLIGILDNETEEYIKSYDNPNIVYMNTVAKNEAIRWQIKANALIHYWYPATRSEEVISIKIYEYLMQRKPILSFNEDKGFIKKILDKYNIGAAANSHDIEKMSQILTSAYKGQYQFSESLELEEHKLYDFKYLTERLSKFLNKVILESN